MTTCMFYAFIDVFDVVEETTKKALAMTLESHSKNYEINICTSSPQLNHNELLTQ